MPAFPRDIELGKSGVRNFPSKYELDGFLSSEQEKYLKIFNKIPDFYFDNTSPYGLILRQIGHGGLTSEEYLILLTNNVIFSTEGKYWKAATSKGEGNIDYFVGFLCAYQDAYSEKISFDQTQLKISTNFLLGLGLGQAVLFEEARVQSNFQLYGAAGVVLNEIQSKSEIAVGKLSEIDDFYSKIKLKKQNYQNELDELWSKIKSSTEENVSSLTRDIKLLESSSRDSITRLEKSLSEDALISTTSNYWSDKITRHTSRRNFLTTVSIVYVILLVPIIIFTAIILPAIFKSRQDYYVIFVFGILITIAFWAIRILTRTLLSEQYLAGVSEERKVFVDTYLALIREGGATEAERALMLATIFKSAPANENKDDGATEASLVAFASKILAPK